jgi:hypothetical protein
MIAKMLKRRGGGARSEKDEREASSAALRDGDLNGNNGTRFDGLTSSVSHDETGAGTETGTDADANEEAEAQTEVAPGPSTEELGGDASVIACMERSGERSGEEGVRDSEEALASRFAWYMDPEDSDQAFSSDYASSSPAPAPRVPSSLCADPVAPVQDCRAVSAPPRSCAIAYVECLKCRRWGALQVRMQLVGACLGACTSALA